MVRNYFASKSSACRYAAGRPDFHDEITGRIKDYLQITQPLPKALDVGCGTGLSAKALLPLAAKVYATDISIEMLNTACEKDKINYCLAPAENQPFATAAFDLITVSSAVHWFNIDAFLAEASRLLKISGCLVIYENNFPGKMRDNEGFGSWFNKVYLPRFPSPPRNKNYDWSRENLLSKGFTITIPAEFENQVSFVKSELISYLITQSNVIAAVEAGEIGYSEAEEWLDEHLTLYFENADLPAIFMFQNRMKYLSKTEVHEQQGAL
jgi:ubiquinone/menaquinone biosynthesis C-methylase UbiE